MDTLKKTHFYTFVKEVCSQLYSVAQMPNTQQPNPGYAIRQIHSRPILCSSLLLLRERPGITEQLEYTEATIRVYISS